jgi:hypothetical protein
MIVMLDTEDDDLTQYLALPARREGRLEWEFLQERRQLAKQGGQPLVFDLVVLDDWSGG